MGNLDDLQSRSHDDDLPSDTGADEWSPPAEEALTPEAMLPPPGEEPMAPQGAEAGEDMPPARDRAHGTNRAATAVAYLVVVFALLGVLSTAFAVKLYLEHRAALQTLEDSVQSMALLSAKLGASERIQGRLGWLSKAVERGDWQQARRAAAALRQEDVPAPQAADLHSPGGAAEGQLPDPMKVEEFDPAVRAFFARNADAWRAFLGFTQAAIKIRDLGINVDDLRALRAQILEAARLDQKAQVIELLNQARQLMERKTGPRAGQAFEEQLKRFGRAFAQAQQERRDVAPAGRLAAQAERAARQGDMGRAVRLIAQATDALKHARRLRGGPALRMGMPRMDRRGPGLPDVSFLQFLVTNLNDVMQAERVDLAHVWTQLTTAMGALREKNQDQIREILGEAIEVMDLINVRRTNLSRHLQQAQQSMMRADRPRPQPPARSREEVAREVRQRIYAVLADARKMSDAEFEARRPQLAAALLELLLPGQVGPPRDENLTPEQRVRAKMQMIAQPYIELKRRGVDTAELDGTLTQAREAIMAHDYARAEELVDGTIPLIQELLDSSAPSAQEDSGGGANPPSSDTTTTAPDAGDSRP